MKMFYVLAASLFVLAATAQTRNFMLVKQPAQNNGQRKAVVIGMGNYGGNNTLNNTLKDADDMSQTLTQLGFTVTLIKDNDLQHLTQNLAAWYASIQNSDVALFYFSGHGMEIDGENYLLPVNLAITTESDVKYQTYSLNQVLDNMDEKNVALKLVLLDACRDNPYKKSWHKGVGGNGLAQVTAPDGTFIAYAAAPGHVADDGEDYGLQNGVFTYFAKTELLSVGLTLDQVFNKITGDVKDKTQKTQTPYIAKSVSFDVVLLPGKPPGLSVLNQPPNNNQPVQPPAIIPGLENMVLVQGGTFNMGRNDGGKWKGDDEPSHSVALTSFYISKNEVTVAEFKQFIDATGYKTTADIDEEGSSLKPKHNSGTLYVKKVNWQYGDDGKRLKDIEMNQPVKFVSWYDAEKYCEWKTGIIHKTCRLPTEAEWEFAARGGNKMKNYIYYYPERVAEDKIQPNELGLCFSAEDWCNDWYDSSYYSKSEKEDPSGPISGIYRVVRGMFDIKLDRNKADANGYYLIMGSENIDSRFYRYPSNHDWNCSFRVVVLL